MEDEKFELMYRFPGDERYLPLPAALDHLYWRTVELENVCQELTDIINEQRDKIDTLTNRIDTLSREYDYHLELHH